MRRIALLIIAAALCAAPATATGAPRATDFELSVGADAATAHAAGGAWTSSVLEPGRRFEVVGLRWKRSARDVHAFVRVREDGRWRRWVQASTADASGSGTGPVWAGGAQAVQVRLSRRVRGLKLHFVQVRGSTTTRAAASRPAPVARAASSQPAIIPRAHWGGDSECTPRDAPTMGSVQMAFVHHTVSANEYGPGDSAAMVLGICRFHRNSNGWDDIGYNFLVDKYGQVFEGRAGGVDQPVVGAQAQGWNAQSTSVSNLGTYQDVPQTAQALDAMSRLLAWKLPLHGAPVTGQVTLESAGGASNRFPSGTQHTYERISGHRDGNETACPGNQLYAQLPHLRSLADGKAPDVIPAPQSVAGPGSKLTLRASRRALSYPEPAQLAGRLVSSSGAPIPNTRVRIQILTARGYRAVSSTVTASDGAFTASLPTSRNRSVRALVGKLASNTVGLRVAPALTVRTPARRVWMKRRTVLSGTLRPGKGAVVVEAALQRSATSYRRVLAMRSAAKNGKFRVALPLRKPGLYRLRVRFAGDKRNAPAKADFYVRSVRTAAGAGSSGPPTAGSGGQAAR